MRYPPASITILGDFNYPSIAWTLSLPQVVPFSSNSQCFLDTCNLFNLTQMVTIPTRVTSTSSHTLDLILTSMPETIHSLSSFPGLSDHCMLHFYINSSTPAATKERNVIYDYNAANFEEIIHQLFLFFDTYMILITKPYRKTGICLLTKFMNLLEFLFLRS